MKDYYDLVNDLNLNIYESVKTIHKLVLEHEITSTNEHFKSQEYQKRLDLLQGIEKDLVKAYQATKTLD